MLTSNTQGSRNSYIKLQERLKNVQPIQVSYRTYVVKNC
jgi:hypothetical protein